MVDPKLGEKKECPKCGAKFYDLNKQPPVCPKCGTIYDAKASNAKKKSAAKAAAAASKPAPAAAKKPAAPKKPKP